jgi:hypothetical protein
VLAQFAADNSLLVAHPWAVAGADQDLAPYLTGEIPVPLISDGGAVCAPCSGSSDPSAVATQWPVAQRFLDFRLLGELPSTELLGDIVGARAENRPLDLTLSLRDERAAQTRLLTQPSRFQLDSTWTSPTIAGYSIQLQGPDTAGSLTCAPDAPQHYHAELLKVNSKGPATSLANLTIALYKSKTTGKYCFALANSQGWPACIQLCAPTWGEVYKTFLSGLTSVGVTFFSAAVLASLVATVVIGAMAALAHGG